MEDIVSKGHEQAAAICRLLGRPHHIDVLRWLAETKGLVAADKSLVQPITVRQVIRPAAANTRTINNFREAGLLDSEGRVQKEPLLEALQTARMLLPEVPDSIVAALPRYILDENIGYIAALSSPLSWTLLELLSPTEFTTVKALSEQIGQQTVSAIRSTLSTLAGAGLVEKIERTKGKSLFHEYRLTDGIDKLATFLLRLERHFCPSKKE